MTKVQYYAAATLDGYIAESDDTIEWLMGYDGTYEGEEVEAGPMAEGGSYDRFYEDVGAMVSGSATYEFVHNHLDSPDSWPYKGKPYWVLSSRDIPLLEGDGLDIRLVNAAVDEIKDELLESAGDKNLWVVGGGNVASQFAAAGLLDEVLLTIVPVVIGAGKPVFDERLPSGPMQLTGTSVFGNGMVELRYEIKR